MEQLQQLILKKRDKEELTTEEIQFFVREVTNKNLPDYQVSALLMCIYLNGMNSRETFDLAMAMANSGDHITYPGLEGIKVDKHSSGGVGDKTTLIVGPMVASCGLIVPKMSGRGLGFSGGTIDKLEAIPGYQVELTEEKFLELLKKNGIAVISQTKNIAPADKILYALRDVTGTVESMPLIASSIMSKKLATESDAIVLDVKMGHGAFMKNMEDALELAKMMCAIGESSQKTMMAAVTNMNEPLGMMVGNALEIKEVIEVLKGEGPDDLTELCMVIGSLMLIAGEIAHDMEEAREMLQDTIEQGTALRKFRDMVEGQGGDVATVDNPALLPLAPVQCPVYATSSGYVHHIDAQTIGEIGWTIGANRQTKESVIHPESGVELAVKSGEQVEKGDLLCTIHCMDEESGSKAVQQAEAAFTIQEHPAERLPMLLALVTKEGVQRFDTNLK